MGDPKFPSKHYNTPSHPWQKTRIDQERNLTHQYGLKNKKEIWRADTKVREMRRQARKLTAKASEGQAQKEKNLLLNKLDRLGMLEQGAGLEDVLRMSPENILNRRLQTQVYLQGLASTVKQSRQLIIHGHISVEGAINRVPGMIVTKSQEKNITYSPSSALNSDLHPVRPDSNPSYEDEIQEVQEDSADEKQNEDDTEIKNEDKSKAETDELKREEK